MEETADVRRIHACCIRCEQPRRCERARRCKRTRRGARTISPFRDFDFYYLREPISWKPDASEAARYPLVIVPKGFVTDLASIPRAFWSALPPAANYAYAAIIHDYLYWIQEHARNVADDLLRIGMRDLGVASSTITIIHKAVQLFGGGAWEDNARQKASGEKRVLKAFPTNPTITWREWKSTPDVFDP